ncbi:MAG: HAD family phosphatase [Anaerolineae bacterium]|nr:HAD family phosphatase [Anaerolineae bacterium]
MVRAVVFDLDGTLVQTERLKAVSYARGAVELCPYEVSEEAVIEAYEDVVGLPRHEVASALVERFDLERASRARMDDCGMSAPWQAFVQVRLGYYEDMISDPEALRENQWPHNRDMLRLARETGCRTALATMSGRQRTQQVLEALRLTDAFDFVATKDDVARGKPDPEIYFLVCKELAIPASQTMAIEDSPAGVEAALAADLLCIAVTTPFTREKIHAQGLLESRWIVDDHDRLPDLVRAVIQASS